MLHLQVQLILIQFTLSVWKLLVTIFISQILNIIHHLKAIFFKYIQQKRLAFEIKFFANDNNGDFSFYYKISSAPKIATNALKHKKVLTSYFIFCLIQFIGKKI